MKSSIYQFLLSVSFVLLIIFIYSCDLTTPVDISLINLSEEELDFGLFTNELRFTVENNDTLDIYYDIQTWPDWITVTPASGNLASMQTDTFVVAIDRAGLDIGDYGGDIYVEIMDADEDLYVPISMQVKPAPIFTPQQLNFNASETRGTFTIQNQGNHDLIWKASSLQNWLTVEPDSGTTEPAPRNIISKRTDNKTMEETSTLTVTVNRNLLEAGVHVGLVEIDSDFQKDTLFVTVPQSEEPQISVTPRNLSFTRDEPTQYVTVDNAGDGLLEWEASSPDSWVTITPSSGTISTDAVLSMLSKYNILTSTMSTSSMQVEITVNLAEVSEGDITSRVDFTSNGGDQTIDLTINNTIPEEPVLDLSVNELNFGLTQISIPFDVVNAGTGTLDWTVSTTEGSLTLTPTSGSTTTSETVTVDLDRTQVTEPGTHTFSIDVNSNGGNDAVTVIVEVGEPPLLNLQPGQITLDENNLSLPMHITNDGGGELEWHAIPSVDWLIVSADSGTTTQTTEVMISVNPASELAPGTYGGIVDVFSNGGDDFVNVTYIVPENPTLSVAPQELDFGATESILNFEIYNVGSGTLTWTIDKVGTWFGVTQGAGETTTETDVIEVNVNRDALEPGDYTGYAIVNSNGGVDTVKLIMKVMAEPQLAVSESDIDFSTTDNEKTFTVKNDGTGELIWSAQVEYITGANLNKKTTSGKTHSVDWLFLDPAGGSTFDFNEVTAFADRYKLEAGLSEAIIHITSNGGDVDIRVSIFADSPVISVDPTQLNFGTSERYMTFTIKNDGGQELDWNSSIEYFMNDVAPWLSVQPESGLTENQTTVDVFVTRDGLASGVYEAYIHITSNAGNKDVHVKMQVEGPVLDVSTNSLNFGSTGSALNFDIINNGAGDLEWYAYIEYNSADDPPWLGVYPNDGTVSAQTSVTVTADRGALPTGVYNAVIRISSNGGEKTINVEITVSPSSINASPMLLDFGTSDTELPLSISNSGGGTLYYQLSSNESWISFSVAGGSVTTNTDEITVYVDRNPQPSKSNSVDQINSNTIYGSIWIQNINDQNNHVSVDVEMTTLDPPVLDVDPTELAFGTSFTTLQIGIKNLGEDTLEWGVIVSGPDAAIIHIDAANGTTTTETDIINVTVPRNISASDYSCSIDFYTNGGDLSVPVTWTVLPN